MLIVPNNKLSNHYRKKKTEKTVWIEDQTVSSSFQQNMETMQEKTGIRMFYEDYLNPSVSFSNNGYPDFYSSYPSLPSNNFGNSMMNPYNNSNDGMEGLKGFVGGDVNSAGNNNSNFVDGMMLGELTDSQNIGWTVMMDYNVNDEMQTQGCSFNTT